VLRAALTAEQANDLGAKLEEGKKTAPTRPHPNTPASPGLLKTAGPAVAAADRARDAASGLFRKAQSDSRKGAEIGKKMLASRLNG
jgi:hypothetical protein